MTARSCSERRSTCRLELRRGARVLLPASLLALALLLLAAPLASAALGDYTCSDPSKVYFGNHRLFRRPCHISCDQVYDKIPEYQEIVRKGLTAKDARYHLLMKKASARFSAAVKKMARANNYDLVAFAGSVKKNKKTAKDVPDRTASCIEALED